MNNYYKNKKCSNCKKLITNNANRYGSCAMKNRLKNPKNHPKYIDNRTNKKYYCKICKKEITCQTANYGQKRCQSCAVKYLFKTGKFDRIGKNCGSFKGGITPLHLAIRHLQKYKQWRTEVFERDGFTCRECSHKSQGDIEAHHKKEFHTIFAEFLKEYDQFSPIEDKETLIRLAIKYKDFWNIDNGITLCKECHKLTRRNIKIL